MCAINGRCPPGPEVDENPCSGIYKAIASTMIDQTELWRIESRQGLCIDQQTVRTSPSRLRNISTRGNRSDRWATTVHAVLYSGSRVCGREMLIEIKGDAHPKVGGLEAFAPPPEKLYVVF